MEHASLAIQNKQATTSHFYLLSSTSAHLLLLTAKADTDEVGWCLPPIGDLCGHAG